MLATMRQLSAVKSTTVVCRYGILTICPPLPLGGAQGGKMTNIAHLLVMAIDLTSETWYELANGAPDHRTVLYRSGIHAVLAEISHTCHLGLCPKYRDTVRTWCYFLLDVVRWDSNPDVGSLCART